MQKFSNNITLVLDEAISPGDTSISVESTSGVPTLEFGSDFILFTLENSNGIEIMKCTQSVTGLVVVERAQEGTTAIAGSVGDVLEGRLTANSLGLLQQAFPVTEETGTTRFLDLSDENSYIYCSNASGCSINLPPQSSESWRPSVEIRGRSVQAPVSFVEGSGVTIDVPEGKRLEVEAKSLWTLKREAADSWALFGALTDLEGYLISEGVYDNTSLDVTAQEAFPRGIEFNSNGTKLYVIGENSASVHQYTLSTPYDVGTATYDTVSLDVSGAAAFPCAVVISSDGTKLFAASASTDAVYQYTLSTPFDVSTGTYDSVSLSIAGKEATLYSITMSEDGTNLYAIGPSSDSVHQYTMTTAFDLSTASFTASSPSLTGQLNTPSAVAIKDDGSKMYVVGTVNNTVFQYTLSTPFDPSTASYDSVSFDISSQDFNMFGLKFNPGGTKMYAVGNSNNSIYQYSTVA